MNYLRWLGLALAVISILGLGVSGPGYRLGLWGFPTGISLVKYSAFLSLAAVVVCLLGLGLSIAGFGSKALIPALIGLVIGGFVAVLMLKWKHNLDSVPYIHDITTDTANPPLFEAILPLRAGAGPVSDFPADERQGVFRASARWADVHGLPAGGQSAVRDSHRFGRKGDNREEAVSIGRRHEVSALKWLPT